MKKTAFLAAVVILLGLAAAAQDEYPKFELGLDYSYARFSPSHNYIKNSYSLNGGGGSFDYNFDKYFGLRVDLQGYGSNTQTFSAPSGSAICPAGCTANVQGNLFTYQAGPQIGKRWGRIRPFGDLLFGGAHSNVYGNLSKIPGITIGKAPSLNAFAMTVGGGLDIALNQKGSIALRPGEFDYLYTRFNTSSINTTGQSAQSSFRYLAGLVFNLGIPNPAPPTAACSATPTELLPWDGPVNASVAPAAFNPKHTLAYNWASTGGTVQSDNSSAKIDPTSLTPGNYTVTATVNDSKEKKLNSASCTASFTVKQPQPPVVSCSANPTTVQVGQPITVSASANSPDQQKLQSHDFSASAGSVQEGQTSAGTQPGSLTSTATLDTTNVPPGPLSVTVNVTDVHGLKASCVASANVQAPPQQVTVVKESLISECEFKNEHKRARVDNECKAILDEVALRLQQNPDGRVVVVGYAEEEEVVDVQDVDAYRAYNSKKYLTAGEAKQNIDPTRLEVRKSSARDQGKKAKFYFVPAGGTFTETDTVIVDETQMPADTMGIPKKSKAKSSGRTSPTGAQ